MIRDEITPRATVADLCRLHGITARALRYYEEEGLIAPQRDARNRRRYDARAFAAVGTIVELRRAGVSLSDIQTFLALEDAQAAGPAARAFLAQRLAHRLGELRKEMAAVEHAATLFGAEAPAQPAPPVWREPARRRAGAHPVEA